MESTQLKSIIFKKKTKDIDIDQFINNFVDRIKSPIQIISFDFCEIQPWIGIYYKIYYKFE